MSSAEQPFKDPASGAPAPSGASGLATRVHKLSRQPPPAPKGRNLVISLIAGAAVIAAIVQISGGASGVRGEKGENLVAPAQPGVPEQPGVSPVTPPGPTPLPQPPEPTPVAPEPVEPTPAPPPPVVPAPEPKPVIRVKVPSGLSERTASHLGLALNGIAAGYAAAAIELPRVVAGSSDEERPIVRGAALDVLARLAGTDSGRALAFDVALHLAGDDTEGMGPLVRTAADAVGEGKDVPEALVFLHSVPAAMGAAAAEAVLGFVTDSAPMLYQRILGARVLARWGAAPDERAALAEKSDTPEVLRQALLGED